MNTFLTDIILFIDYKLVTHQILIGKFCRVVSCQNDYGKFKMYCRCSYRDFRSSMKFKYIYIYIYACVYVANSRSFWFYYAFICLFTF